MSVILNIEHVPFHWDISPHDCLEGNKLEQDAVETAQVFWCLFRKVPGFHSLYTRHIFSPLF